VNALHAFRPQTILEVLLLNLNLLNLLLNLLLPICTLFISVILEASASERRGNSLGESGLGWP